MTTTRAKQKKKFRSVATPEAKRVPPPMDDFQIVFSKLGELMRMPETRRLIQWEAIHGSRSIWRNDWLHPYLAANDLAGELASIECGYDFGAYAD